MRDVKLRDERKPGYCWQDNELYDAFGPVIGPHAVLVYGQLTRECWGGETQVTTSSRDLAEACGLSKDTVQRMLKVMERVGMVRVTGGGDRRTGEYHLVDLKELAIAYEGRYDAKRRCVLLPAAATASLRLAVQEVLATVRRKNISKCVKLASPRLALEPAEEAVLTVAPSGAPSASLHVVSQAAGAPDVVDGSARSGALEGQLTSYYKKEDKQPPPNPLTEGEPISLAGNIASMETLDALFAEGARLEAQLREMRAPRKTAAWFMQPLEVRQARDAEIAEVSKAELRLRCAIAAIQEARRPKAMSVQTGADPPQRRRQRRWTPAMIGARM